jgi:formylglycine-generating enzyme required for sulfatase activity
MYDPAVACAHDQKVARGGGWFSSDPNVVRTQVRQGYPPASRSANVGIRCAKSL